MQIIQFLVLIEFVVKVSTMPYLYIITKTYSSYNIKWTNDKVKFD